ncbi:MAG: aldehyde dehydrogenase [Spirochaetales bacterium]
MSRHSPREVDGGSAIDERLSSAVFEQRQHFRTGLTRDISKRIETLDRLRAMVRRYQNEILEALAADLGKPQVESYTSEIAIIYQELALMRRKLRSWAKPRRRFTPLALAFSSSYMIRQPYGVSLIIAPWNYPVQLSLTPAIGALAAGNTVVLKPSEVSERTSALIAKMVGETFEPGLFRVIEGNKDVAAALLEQPFDYIFYTGNTEVGRIVLRNAAERLIPVTLELGGKSPCIVTARADVETAARRIAWGKYLNAGQTCIAPDYCLVHERIYEQFIQSLERAVTDFYGTDPAASPDYARIVAARHLERIQGLIDTEKVAIGGEVRPEQRYVAPTVMRDVSWSDPVMEHEIFGPLLPVLSYKDEEEVFDAIDSRSRPLALYVFTEDRREAGEITTRLSFGGGCVNDTVVHVASSRLPFGGVGASGMGRYRGKASFDTFSYQKSVLNHRSRPDFRLRYPPYAGKLKLLKRLIG